jgi:hypothetical protein
MLDAVREAGAMYDAAMRAIEGLPAQIARAEGARGRT